MKEFCDERLLVSDVIAQNDENIKEKKKGFNVMYYPIWKYIRTMI